MARLKLVERRLIKNRRPDPGNVLDPTNGVYVEGHMVITI